jgi:hypothetical protein
MADTLGGLFGGRLQDLDDQNPLAKWVAQSWPIWHHYAIYVANCVRYCNDDEDTIWILEVWCLHGTIQGLKLQDKSLLGRPCSKYISLIYMTGGLPQSLSQEKMLFIELEKDASIRFKLIWY